MTILYLTALVNRLIMLPVAIFMILSMLTSLATVIYYWKLVRCGDKPFDAERVESLVARYLRAAELGKRLDEIETHLLPKVALAFLVTAPAVIAVDIIEHMWLSLLIDLIWSVMMWHAWKNRKNKKKKRLAKALARVKEAAGRLVVVPVPATQGALRWT